MRTLRCVLQLFVALLGAFAVLLADSGEARAFRLSTVCPQTGTCGTIGVTTSNANQITHPEIVLIFWEDGTSGNVWSQNYNSPNPSYGQWVGGVMSIVNGPYYGAVQQYGSNGGQLSRPRLSAYAPIYHGDPPSGGTTSNFSFTTTVKSIIEDSIQRGLVPAVPSPWDGMEYVVIAPPGTSASDCAGTGCNLTDSYNGATYGKVIIQANLNQPWPTFSHETVEGIAVLQGAKITGCTGGNGIADVCCSLNSSYQYTEDGLPLASYWSVADNACVVPDSWGQLYVSAGQGYSWSAPGPSGTAPLIRQASGGNGGVLVTGNDDNVYWYPGGSNYWNCYFSPSHAYYPKILASDVSMVSAGGGLIATLPMDATGAIKTYATSGGYNCFYEPPWTSLPQIPSGLAVTSLSVTSGGDVIVTDGADHAYYYPIGGPSWGSIDTSGDPVVAFGSDVLAANPSNPGTIVTRCESRYNFGAAGCVLQNWLQSSMVSNIIANPDTGYYGYILTAGGMDAAYWSQNYVTYSEDFAVSAAYEANYELAHNANFSNRLATYACYSSPNYCAGNAWEATNGVVGRVISGTQMAGTGCDSNTSDWCLNICNTAGQSCQTNADCCGQWCGGGVCQT